MERRNLPTQEDWPLIRYDPNLCLTCLRCVKVCHEVIGAGALSFLRWAITRVSPRLTAVSWIAIFVGNVLKHAHAARCPTRSPRGHAHGKLRKTPTVCPLCSAGCRMEVNVKDSRIFRITTNIESHNGALYAWAEDSRLISFIMRTGS